MGGSLGMTGGSLTEGFLGPRVLLKLRASVSP